jgi:hypothetical protein
VRRSIAVLALALLVAGCGGRQDEPSAAGPPAQSAAPAPAPSPSALTVAEAGPRYLQIVAPYNKALEEMETAANSGKSWTTVRALAGKVAETNEAHARALRATVWPDVVRTPMAALLVETDIAQRYWEAAARAKTVDELARALRSGGRHTGAKPAGEIRAKLGLPAYSES